MKSKEGQRPSFFAHLYIEEIKNRPTSRVKVPSQITGGRSWSQSEGWVPVMRLKMR